MLNREIRKPTEVFRPGRLLLLNRFNRGGGNFGKRTARLERTVPRRILSCDSKRQMSDVL
jgi:hypothetical protein